MISVKEHLRRLLKNKVFVLGLIPIILAFFVVLLGYKPYRDYIERKKELYKAKKELFKRYREKAGELEHFKEEEKRLREKVAGVVNICTRQKIADEALSNFFQTVSTEAKLHNLTLNIQQPTKEEIDGIEIYSVMIEGNLTDLKPLLLFLEKIEESGKILTHTLELRVVDPQNPSTLQVRLKLVSCNVVR